MRIAKSVKDMEQLEVLYTAHGRVNWYNHIGNSGSFWKTCLPHDPLIPLQGIYLREMSNCVQKKHTRKFIVDLEITHQPFNSYVIFLRVSKLRMCEVINMWSCQFRDNNKIVLDTVDQAFHWNLTIMWQNSWLYSPPNIINTRSPIWEIRNKSAVVWHGRNQIKNSKCLSFWQWTILEQCSSQSLQIWEELITEENRKVPEECDS